MLNYSTLKLDQLYAESLRSPGLRTPDKARHVQCVCTSSLAASIKCNSATLDHHWGFYKAPVSRLS